MEKAVIYARFSSDKQTEASIAAQERACREYAAAHDLSIIKVYADEAISGKGVKTMRRHQYQQMLRDAQRRAFDVILIHQYDRIARSLGEHVNLEIKLQGWGVRLVAVAQDFGSGKEAKIMRALMWSMSEYYIDNLAEESRKGLKETALKGLHTGGYAPFGYDVVDQRYVVNALEAGYVRRIFDAAQAGDGYQELIAEMERCGITGKRGKPIRYPQIYEILRNRKYTGEYRYSPVEEKSRDDRREKPNAIKIENALPQIVSKAQFEEVQKIMKVRKHTGKRADYMCSGMVYCGCGAKMHGITTHKKGHEYRYYTCSAKCGIGAVRMDDVDAAAVAYLQELLSEDNQEKIAAALRRYQAGEGGRMEEFRAALDKRIQEKRAQYDALMKNLSSAALPPDILADIGKQMQSIKSEIAALEATEPPQDFTTEQVRAWLESIKAAPDAKAVKLLVDRIDVKTKTEFNITSTLNSVLSETGCGGAQHILPTILFRFSFRPTRQG